MSAPNPMAFGRLLRSSTVGCVVGCRVTQLSAPAFGALVAIPLDGGSQAYGLVYDIRIDDDGLVRQLVTAGDVPDGIIADSRLNRNVPVEVSVLFIGYRQGNRILHLLPPRPPLSLDAIFICDAEEVCRFSSAGHFGYFRHILRPEDLPVGELLAAHLQQASSAHAAAGETGWFGLAAQEAITLLRDDYPALMGVLGALDDCNPG